MNFVYLVIIYNFFFHLSLFIFISDLNFLRYLLPCFLPSVFLRISPFLQIHLSVLSLPTYKQHFPIAVSFILCFTFYAVLTSAVVTCVNTEKFGTVRPKKSALAETRALMTLEIVNFAFSLLL